MLVQVLHAFATEGAHCTKVRDILNASDVSCDTCSDFSYCYIFAAICSCSVYLLSIFCKAVDMSVWREFLRYSLQVFCDFLCILYSLCLVIENRQLNDEILVHCSVYCINLNRFL